MDTESNASSAMNEESRADPRDGMVCEGAIAVVGCKVGGGSRETEPRDCHSKVGWSEIALGVMTTMSFDQQRWQYPSGVPLLTIGNRQGDAIGAWESRKNLSSKQEQE